MENLCEGKPVSLSARRHPLLLTKKKNELSRSKIIGRLETLALKVAEHHAEGPCLIVGIDFVDFFFSFQEKDLLTAMVSVNRCWDHSMEIGVKVVAEDFRLLEQKDVLRAYFLVLGVDQNLCPSRVPPVIPETEEEKKRFLQAGIRRQMRMFMKNGKNHKALHTFYLDNP